MATLSPGYRICSVLRPNWHLSSLAAASSLPTPTKATRDGYLLGVLEWKPNVDYASLLDVYYRSSTRRPCCAATRPACSGAAARCPSTVGPGIDPTGTRPASPVLRNDSTNATTTSPLGWNNKFNLQGNGWTAVGDLSYSKANRDESIRKPTPVPSVRRDTVRTTDNNGRPCFPPWLNYADPNVIGLLDSGGSGQDGYTVSRRSPMNWKSMKHGKKRPRRLL